MLHKILAKVAPLAEFKWMACRHGEKNAQNGHDSHYNNAYYHYNYNNMYDPRSLYQYYYHPQKTETHPHSSFHTPSQPPVVDKESSGAKAEANPDQTKKPHAKKSNKFFKLMRMRLQTIGVRTIKAFIS